MFQKAKDMILLTVKWQFALAYFEDIAIFSKSISDHLSHLLSVASLLSNAVMSLRLRKSFFFDNKIYYLGLGIKLRKLDVSVKETDAICGLEQQTNVAELKSFLGLYNVFHRFVYRT